MRELSRAALVAVACVALLGVVILVALWTPGGQRIEDAVLAGAAATAGSPAQAQASSLLATVGAFSLTAAAILALIVGLVRRRVALAVLAAALVIVAALTTQVLQELLVRPILLDSGRRRLDQSFPSGHSGTALAAMVALLLVVPRRLRVASVLLLAPWAVGVGVATVVAGWHRPSDVLGSDLIVLAYACATVALLAALGQAAPMSPSPARTAPRVAIAAGAAVSVVAALVVSGAMPLDSGDAPAYLGARVLTLVTGFAVPVVLLVLLRHVDVGGTAAVPAVPRPRSEGPVPLDRKK